MFIAGAPFLLLSSVGAQPPLPAWAFVPLPGLAPKGAKILAWAFAAINISLRWSENQFHCCTSKLNPLFTNEKCEMRNGKSSLTAY